MHKLLRIRHLAVSAAIVLAAGGCSTNTHDAIQTNAPAPAVLRGAQLTSPRINSAGPASMTTPSTEALAITAANATRNGRFLGYIEGAGSSPSGNYTRPTGQFDNPTQYTNPQVTVNSSISSPATPVIISDAGLGGAVATTGAIATTGALTANGTGAPVFTTAAAVATPATTAIAATPGMFAAGPGGTIANGGALTPTVSSAALPSPLVAANPAVAVARPASTTTTRNTAASTAAVNSTVVPMTANATVAAIATGTPARPITGTTITNFSGGVRATSGSASSNVTRANIAPINSALANGMTSSSSINDTAAVGAQIAERQRIANTPVTSQAVAPATVVPSRQRAVQTPASGITAPVSSEVTPVRRRASSNPANGPTEPKQRAVRVTSAPDGTAVITNTDSPTFQQRVHGIERDQQ